jgi:hypothetical protein
MVTSKSIQEIFIFTHNKKIIKKVIMGLIDKIQNKKDQPIQADSFNSIELNKRETEFLLQTIRNSQFKGEDVEVLYNLVLKVQKLYIYHNSIK